MDVLRVPKVEFPDYPSCEHLRTMSKDELMAAFYEHPFDWGDHQFTPCRTFAKGPRFINMVMTFVLHPLSHYNSITEPRARFLLSLLKHLTIDFPSHFFLSMGGFAPEASPPPPPPVASNSEDKDDDNGDDDDASNDDDGDASSTDEMST